ncbi:glycine oxidase ThiO [Thermocrinis minervae]|uniref:Glycine oxidase n=1 Tax=Thermocrinis minervae TaxID=381751 RepID=A0A1M6T681_9AQUI|nr:glycine oxidase ThiO [Thermocrinis minervae]SHK52491.1 glycine oxidase [Thermocrinis minervae]
MTKIIVVGSGIIGLSCALRLLIEGYRVAIITKNTQESTSWVAGGMLAPFSEGLKGYIFDFSYQSLKEFPQFVKVAEETSSYKVSFWQEGIRRLVLEGEEDLLSIAEAYTRMGYKLHLEEPTSDLSSKVKKVIHYEEEGWVDTEELMSALWKAAERLGAELVIDHIREVRKKDGYVEEVVGIKGCYEAEFYVFATGAWTGQLFDLPVFPIKGQALKVKGVKPSIVHYSSVSYLIPRERYLYIGATSERVGFLEGVSLEGVKRLSEGAIQLMPALKDSELISTLYGFRPASPDELPIFETGNNYIVATGHYRNGILHGPITSKIVLEYLQGKKSPFLDIFSSERFKHERG